MKLIPIILFVAFWTDLHACDCASTQSLEQTQIAEYDFSEYVFVGEISPDDFAEESFDIVVIEVFKGELNAGQKIIVTNNIYCDPSIDEAGKWLIYARSEEGLFRMNICGLSRNLNFPENNRHFNNPPSVLRSDSTQIEKKEAFNLKSFNKDQRKMALIETKKEIEALRKKKNR